MTDSAAARAPEVDPFASLDAPPNIDWGDFDSDHDDDEARALIAKVGADAPRDSDHEVGEIQPARNAHASLNGHGKHPASSSPKREKEELEDNKKETERKWHDNKKGKNNDPGAGGWDSLFPSQNDWQGGGKKWQKQKKQVKDKSQHHCPICDVYTTGEKARDSHLRGKQHMTKKRQADLKAKNEELNRHGASIAEKQARRQEYTENGESRLPNRSVDRRTGPVVAGSHSDVDRRAGENETAVRGAARRDFEPPAPGPAFYGRSTDPRPRYFDTAVVPDSQPTRRDAMNKSVPLKDPYGNAGNAAPRKSASTKDTERAGIARSAPPTEKAATTDARTDDHLPKPTKSVSRTPAPPSSRRVTPGATPAGLKDTAAPDSGQGRPAMKGLPSAAYAGSKGVSPFVLAGPRKRSPKRNADENSPPRPPRVGEEMSATPVAEGCSPPEKTKKVSNARNASTTEKEDGSLRQDKTGISSGDSAKDTMKEKAGVVMSGRQHTKPHEDGSRHGMEPEAKRSVDSSKPSSSHSREPKPSSEGEMTDFPTRKDMHERRKYDNKEAASRRVSRFERTDGASIVDDKTVKQPVRKPGGHGESRTAPSKQKAASTREHRDAHENDTPTSVEKRRVSPPSDSSGLSTEGKMSGRERRREREEGSGRPRSYDREDTRERNGTDIYRQDDSRGSKSTPPHDRDDWEKRSPGKEDPYEKRKSPNLDRDAPRERRRSPTYERSGPRESRRSPTYERDDLRDGRTSPPYQRDGPRDSRRSPTYERDSPREGRRSPTSGRDTSRESRRSPYSREDSRDVIRSPSYGADDPREFRRESSYDRDERRRDNSRVQRSAPSYERDDHRVGRNSKPYDRSSFREQRNSSSYDRDGSRPLPDSKKSALGDRERSRLDPRKDPYGEDPRDRRGSSPLEPEKGREKNQDRLGINDKGVSGPERTGTKNGPQSSRERSMIDVDRRVPDSSNVQYDMSGRSPAPALKFRSQAVPARQEEVSYRESKKRRFDSGNDNSREAGWAASNGTRTQDPRSSEGSVRYESVTGSSQRRRLQDRRDLDFKGQESHKERSGEEYRRRDAGPSGRIDGDGRTADVAAARSSPRTCNPEEYPIVSREYLNTPMPVTEWRELRHSVLSGTSDVDKLAYKMMQELVLSPVLGINETLLAPLSNAMMSAVNKHYVTPHGICAKLSDFPTGLLRMDPKYNSELKADADWSQYQTPEYLALCQFRDNLEYTFDNHRHQTKPTSSLRSDAPPRGSFGAKNQRKGPGVPVDGMSSPRYQDAVATDPLYTKLIHHYTACDMQSRSANM